MVSRTDPQAVLLPHPDEPVPVLLMNTIWADRNSVHDALGTTGELAAWLAAVGGRLFAGGERAASALRRADLDDFRHLRDALRRLAAEVSRDTRPRAVEAAPHLDLAEALNVLNIASAAAPPAPTLLVPGWQAQLSPVAGARVPTAALSAVAALAVATFAGTGREGVRACQAPGCVLYFVKDHPRREWCSAVCGNRARAARHYQRHRSGATQQG